MQVQVFEIGDPKWPALLSRLRHDVEHIPECLAAVDRFQGTASRLFVVDDGESLLIVPLTFKELDGGLLDASTPNVRATPLFSEGATDEWRSAAVSTFLDRLAEMGTVSLFLRFHPLLDSGVEAFERFGAVVNHGPMYAVKLDRPLEEIRADYHKDHRYRLRQAKKLGVVPELDRDWQHLDLFHEIYTGAMDRVGARDEYRFSKAFFAELRDALGESGYLWLLKLDGEVAAISIVTEHDGIVQGLYSARHPDFYRRFSDIAAYDSVIERAHEQGNRVAFFEGAATEAIGKFKERITTFRPPSRTGRIIVNPVEYGRLCGDWQERSGGRVGWLDTFFPPYRQPIEQLVAQL